jgi:hypothetical protein
MAWAYRHSQAFRSALEKDNEASLCPRVLRRRFDVVERGCRNHRYHDIEELQEQHLRSVDLHDHDHQSR